MCVGVLVVEACLKYTSPTGNPPHQFTQLCGNEAPDSAVSAHVTQCARSALVFSQLVFVDVAVAFESLRSSHPLLLTAVTLELEWVVIACESLKH